MSNATTDEQEVIPEASVDFPLAWIIVRKLQTEDHYERCSYRQTFGALLCDCGAIYRYFNKHKDEYSQVAKTTLVRHIRTEECPKLRYSYVDGKIRLKE